MKPLAATLEQKKLLVSDGAWGTFLHQQGLQPGECPESWNLNHRDKVLNIAQRYIEAGADIILTNSFGASPQKLKHYNLDGQTAEINKAAAEISRQAAGTEHLVLGSIGPTGVMLMMGEVSEQTLYDGFRIQAEALATGGVDVICIETMSAVDEATLAIRAAREVTDLEVACTFTFEHAGNNEFKTMMGVSPKEMVAAVQDAGASIIGSNCGNGFEQMIPIVRQIRYIDASTPVLIHANAGKPVYQNGETIFPETPEMMAERVPELIKNGANIIGGCCGTTPEHIRAIAREIQNYR